MRQFATRRLLIFLASALFCATLLIAAVAFKPLPLLIWNASDSVPVGFYRVRQQQPQIGEIAVVKLPDLVRLYAASRAYLPDDAWLLKPVFARSGAVVCRFGIFIFVDGELVAHARKLDSQKRILPVWKGCRTLESDEVFLLAELKKSFDGRYFGPVKRDMVVGTAIRLRLPFREVQ